MKFTVSRYHGKRIQYSPGTEAKTRYRENKKYFQKLKKMKPGQVDPIMTRLHYEVFSKIDCLRCANCCRGTGPPIEREGYKPPCPGPQNETG